MKVILRQDVDELGLEGDVVNVATGYARNYLIPKGRAFEATPQNRNTLELQRKKIDARKLKAKEQAEGLKERISDIEVVFSQKAGEEGKLYGSITRMDIASALEEKGVVIDRKKIVMERPIKKLGEFEFPVKLYADVIGKVKVVVGPEENKE